MCRRYIDQANQNLLQFFHVTIGKTGSFQISAIKLSVI